MHKMNRQTFIAQAIGLKCSQGSETLFDTGVNYLLGQMWLGQDDVAAHFKGWEGFGGEAIHRALLAPSLTAGAGGAICEVTGNWALWPLPRMRG